VCYAIGFPAAALSRILNRTFFGLKDTWTPTALTFLRMGFKILLAWVLISPFVHLGIALAESISQIVRVLCLYVLLPNLVKGHEGWGMVTSVGRTLGASLGMAGAIFLVQGHLHARVSIPLELAALVLLGGIFYGVLSFLFQGTELHAFLNALSTLWMKYRRTTSNSSE
jgi:peptidoglycan biosynthesis protein MviN/MurJ (putative lipid II flippase)